MPQAAAPQCYSDACAAGWAVPRAAGGADAERDSAGADARRIDGQLAVSAAGGTSQNAFLHHSAWGRLTCNLQFGVLLRSAFCQRAPGS